MLDSLGVQESCICYRDEVFVYKEQRKAELRDGKDENGNKAAATGDEGQLFRGQRYL